MAIKHKIRNRSGKLKTVKLTARKAILEFCKECMGWDYKNVKTCTAKNCPLYPFLGGTKNLKKISKAILRDEVMYF